MNLCELLDRYLDSRLVEADRNHFESHLAECPACAEEVRLARKIDALLASATTAAPPHLAADFTRALDARRRRRRRRTAALVVAAGLLLAAMGVWRVWPQDASRHTANDRPSLKKAHQPQYATRPVTPDPPPGDAAPPVLTRAERVTVRTGPGAIALERPSGDPTVHVFWIYPAMSVSAQAPESPSSSAELERNAL